MLRNIFLKALNKYASRWLVLCIDVFLVCFSFILSYIIRFDFSFDFKIERFYNQLPLVFIVALVSFLFVGSYKGIIRHTGTKDVFNVFFGVTIFSLSISFIVIVNQLFLVFEIFTIPKSIILIHYLVSVFALILSRYIFKAFYEVLTTELKSITNALIYGAGDSGIITYGALTRETKNSYDIVGFIDDDPNKINKKIDRIKIYSFSKINTEFIKKYNITEVIISTKKIKPSRLLEITDNLLHLNIKVKIVPPLTKWIDGALEVNQIKQVNIDDLLGRQQILIDNPIVKREVDDKIILVTGAAGSIGSEISRQLASYNLKHLVLIDQAESALYDLQQEFIRKAFLDFLLWLLMFEIKKECVKYLKNINHKKFFMQQHINMFH